MSRVIDKISWLKSRIQRSLFPYVEECFNDPVTAKQKRLITVLEIVEVERYIRSGKHQWMGRKLSDRRAIARALVAKTVYNLATTKMLLETLMTVPNVRRICGFEKRNDVPSESTFSRAFAKYAEGDLGEKVHEALVNERLSGQLIGHIAKDSTAIKGREKPVKKPKKKVKTASKKRGRPKKGEVRESKPEEKRLVMQVKQTPEVGLSDIPTACDVGTKKNAKGYKESWVGYKLHMDTSDCGLPLTAVLSSASLHDSQVAIPMMKMTTKRVEYLYDLMDSAYDAAPIYEVSRTLGHVPIIDKNPRGKKDVPPMEPSQALRYNERSAAERSNARLKEEFGGRSVMVRGYKKVKLHLMLGVLVLFADQMLKLLP